jgi:hypothetical protein
VSASAMQPGARKRGNTNNLKPHWVKGQSGNPKGRPPADQDIAAMCRIHTAEAVQALVDTMRLKSHKDRIPATLALLDRGWGKPKQQLEVSADADAIGMHLVAARALVAAFDVAVGQATLPPTLEGRADSEPTTNALDAPPPKE